jgi:3-deoxy-7-phosphoheptulonate synthase
MFQVGARNMQVMAPCSANARNRSSQAVSATVEEGCRPNTYEGGTLTWCCAAYPHARNRDKTDVSAIPIVKKLSHLPIVGDPSHGAGRRDMVAPMARAAVAAGADGLIIEVHYDPDHALSDGAQSMFPAQFDRLMAELRIIAPAIGRSICLEPAPRRGWGT